MMNKGFNWLFNTPKTVHEGEVIVEGRLTLQECGYKLIENNPELSVYRKDEVYGKKMIHVYLSSDCVPLVRCFELVSGEPMSMTIDELIAARNALNTKAITDWKELYHGE